MKKNCFTAIFFFFFAVSVFAQNYKVIKINDLEKLIHEKNDTALIINFWASWCKPCVAELPHFEEIAQKNLNKPLKILLVSIDFIKTADIRVTKIIREKSLKNTVLLLDEPNFNSWIDKIDPDWQGAIPATIVYDSHKHKFAFYEKELSLNELENIVKLITP